MRVTRVEPPAGGAVCAAILAMLPDFFGIPEANDHYVEFAAAHDTWVATDGDGIEVGLLSGRRHFPECAEIEIMAVHPEWHRRGVGRALVDAFAAYHASEGVSLVEVKTLGASHPDAGYARTRDFYLGIGFLRVEETQLWGPDNPALIMVKPIR